MSGWTALLAAVLTWATGFLGGFWGPALKGFIEQLWADYQRNKQMADLGAAKQREADAKADEEIRRAAEETKRALDKASNADVDRQLGRW